MQAVEVRASSSSNRQHPYTFTFCLERVDTGPYKVIMTLLGPLTLYLPHQATLEGRFHNY